MPHCCRILPVSSVVKGFVLRPGKIDKPTPINAVFRNNSRRFRPSDLVDARAGLLCSQAAFPKWESLSFFFAFSLTLVDRSEILKSAFVIFESEKQP